MAAATSSLAAPLDRNLETPRCNNENNTYSLDLAVAGCTARRVGWAAGMRAIRM